jgi:geranylgeranyl diphosphate synthase type II
MDSLLDAKQYRSLVEEALRQVFAAAIAEAGKIDGSYAELLVVTRDQLLRGGKRLRPYLTYLAYHGAGGREVDIAPVAASQELFHQFLLIHDDIIDRDLVRHGGINVAGKYYHDFQDRPIADAEARHYGDSYALLAGNASCALGLQAISSSGFNAETKLAALQCVHQMLFEEMGGQLTDVSVSIPGGAPATLEQLLRVARYKTAAYSFITPLKLGAIMAGGPAQLQGQLQEFGESLGIAFQLADDLLGVYGDEKSLGKPILSDISEGKHTLLIHYALAGATSRQAAALRRIWGSHTAGEAELAEARDLLTATGAQAKVTALADQHLQAALAALKPAALDEQVKARLGEVAVFCVKRQY